MFLPKSIAKIFRAVLPSLVALLLLAMVSFVPLTDSPTNILYNQSKVSENVIIVAVDDQSLEPSPTGLGKFTNWGVDYFQAAIGKIAKEKPSAIAVDFFFSPDINKITTSNINELKNSSNQAKTEKEKAKVLEAFIYNYTTPGYNPDYQKFANSINGLSFVTIAAIFDQNSSTLIKPVYALAQNALLSIVNAIPDSSGTLRHAIPYFTVQTGTSTQTDTTTPQTHYPDMAVATAKIALGLDPYDPANLELPTDEQGRLFVNFFGPPNSYKHISFVDVVKGDFEPGTFKDKIVLIGPTSSKQFHDEYVVPTSENSLMSGIEFRANEIQTILDKKFLLPQSQTSEILTILAITLALTLILSATGIILGSLITIVTIIGYYAAAHFAFDRGLILNMVYPFIAIFLTYLTTIAYKYFVTDRHKRQIKTAFSQYVNQSLVDQISENPDQIKLGGENKIVTVFFSDIKDSTALSEKIAIEQWVAQINEYFTVMENLIMQSSGTLDKYEGDAIMAFWNAPISQENHITRAYICAITMKQALKNLHAKWQIEGKPLLEFRIGINTGPAIVGNFGSEHRLDYTAMGDTVNTASRLESAANKTYGTQIIVAGITPEQTPEIALREIDTVLLPGKKEPVTLFEVRALKKDLTAADQELLTIYAQALAAYRSKNFQAALDLFNKLPADTPSQILAARCQNILAGQTIANLDQATMVFKIDHK